MTTRQRLEIHPCWVDDTPCAPLAGLMREAQALQEEKASLDGEGIALERLQRECLKEPLPCNHCRRYLVTAATKLGGMRLGATERSLLLTLPGPDDSTEVIAPEGNRSARESAKRAIRKLLNLGLVETSQQETRLKVSSMTGASPTPRFERRYHLIAAALSPLGAALVARVRPALEAGERLRWGTVPVAAAEAVEEPVEALARRIVDQVAARASRIEDLGEGMRPAHRRLVEARGSAAAARLAALASIPIVRSGVTFELDPRIQSRSRLQN